MVSRLLGLVREAVLLRYLGAGPQLDAFRQALRTGNLIQNLLGEQTLSAAFIPGYSRMLEEGREEEAGRFAGAIFGLLLMIAGALSLVGLLGAPAIVALFNPGYLQDAARVAAGEATVDRFALGVRLVRWTFPMAGVLVLSAWSVGVLNSHRRFFVAYFAPVAWNATIIAAFAWVARGLRQPADSMALESLVVAGAIGAALGGLLQFLVQLPTVATVLRGFRLSLSIRVTGVREALAAFWPMLAGRGAVQLSGHLDGVIASFLVAGAQGILQTALFLYLLPLSLFGLAVAAAELPEMSRETARSDGRERLASAIRRSSFFVVPTAVGYVAFGLLIVSGLFGRGEFGLADRWLLYLVLAVYSFGLPASAVTRQLNTLLFARGLTRIPARVGIERMVLSATLGGVLAFGLDAYRVSEIVGLGAVSPLRLGAVGLGVGGMLAAWYELARVRAELRRHVEALRVPAAAIARMALAAVVALPAGGVAHYFLRDAVPSWVATIAVVALYAGAYLVVARWFGVSELGVWLEGLSRRRQT